jgi:5-methylcytosine-specific restriction endonuclease McrA
MVGKSKPKRTYTKHGDEIRLRAIEMRTVGVTLREISEELGVGIGSVNNWTAGYAPEGIAKTNHVNKKLYPLHRILTENSKWKSTGVKRRLYEEGVFEPLCMICGLGEIWNGSSIILELHHVNGISRDNRIENLQILCPNCHSQTDGHRGRKTEN